MHWTISIKTAMPCIPRTKQLTKCFCDFWAYYSCEFVYVGHFPAWWLFFMSKFKRETYSCHKSMAITVAKRSARNQLGPNGRWYLFQQCGRYYCSYSVLEYHNRLNGSISACDGEVCSSPAKANTITTGLWLGSLQSVCVQCHCRCGSLFQRVAFMWNSICLGSGI